MNFLIFFNVSTALVALVLMLLVTIGFAPHLRLRGHDANSRMSLFVAASSGLVWVRLLWWSLLRPLFGWIGWMAPPAYGAAGQIINTTFNLWAIGAALAALSALHQSLPMSERVQYSWLTVVFYPRRFCVIWRS